MIIEMRIEEDIVNSDIIIFDCTNLTFGHILKFTPIVIKKVDTILVFKKNDYFLYLFLIYIRCITKFPPFFYSKKVYFNKKMN